MQLQFGSRQSYVLPRIPKLAATEERKLDGALDLWLTTLALVLIVIGTALLLASWQEQHKDSNEGNGQWAVLNPRASCSDLVAKSKQ